MKVWWYAILAIFGFAVGNFCLAAEQGVGVQGTVFDQSQSAVPNATVKLSRKGEAPIESQTGENGDFIFKDVSSGSYNLDVIKDGFAPYHRDRFLITGRKPANLKITLTLPVYEQSVSVGSTGDAKGSALGESYLGEKDIQQMSDDPSAFQQQLQAMVGSDAGYRLNGMVIDPTKLPSKDLIRSIRIATGTFSAEYATTWHMMVDIFTDPTQVQFGGNVSARGTTTDLSAQDPFASEKTPYDEIDGNASLHGHVGKRISYGLEVGRRYSDTGNIVNAQVLNAAFEQVNLRSSADSGRHSAQFEATPAIYFGQKDNATGYANLYLNSSNNLGVGDLSLVDHAYRQKNRWASASFTYNHTFSANVSNEFQFSYDSGSTKQYSINTTPEVVVTGAFTGGGNSIGNSTTDTDNFTMKDVLRAVRKKHMLSIGVEAHEYENNNIMANNFNGTYTFTSLSAYQIMMQGLAAGLTGSQIRANGGGASQFQITTGKDAVSASEPDIAGFAQDDFDARSNLGISFGVRAEAQRRTAGVSIAPRFSLKWGIDGSANKPAKTSLQVSLGIFYDRFPLDSILAVERFQSNKTTQYIYTNPDFFSTVPTNLTGAASDAIPSLYALSSHLHASYMVRENVSISRQIGKQGHLNVMFYHSLGQRQYDERNVNAPFAGTYDVNDPESGVRPTGKLENIFEYESEGMNKGSEIYVYYMGGVGKHVTLSGGIDSNFAKGDSFGMPSNPYSLKDDYGRSSSRLPGGHFWGTFTVPHVAAIQPRMFFNPGSLMNITVGEDLNGDTVYNDRPAWATNLNSSTVVRTKYGNFETSPAANQLRIPVNIANGPYLIYSGLEVSRSFTPHFLEHSGGKWKPSFHTSASVNNVLNHPSLSTPQGSLSSSFFGKSTSTSSSPRNFIFSAGMRF